MKLGISQGEKKEKVRVYVCFFRFLIQAVGRGVLVYHQTPISNSSINNNKKRNNLKKVNKFSILL